MNAQFQSLLALNATQTALIEPVDTLWRVLLGSLSRFQYPSEPGLEERSGEQCFPSLIFDGVPLAGIGMQFRDLQDLQFLLKEQMANVVRILLYKSILYANCTCS